MNDFPKELFLRPRTAKILAVGRNKRLVVQITTRFAVEEFFSYKSFHDWKKKNQVPTSYLKEEYKIRRWVYFVLRVAQFRKAKDFFPDELHTRAVELRESQGSRWVRQGWSIATKRGSEKLKEKKEKKKTSEGEKLALAKARFRVP